MVAASDLLGKFKSVIIEPATYLLFSIGFFLFIWGLVEFLWSLNESSDRRQGVNHMIWGIAGMFIMVSVWGIIGLLNSTFGLGVGQYITK